VNIVVFTAIFGNIDRLWSAEAHGIQHIAFVNSRKQEFDLATSRPSAKPVWEQVVLEPGWDNRRTARHYKTLPHMYMPDADVWIWLDCNVRLKLSPQELVKRYLHSDFATFKHPDRNCLYKEAVFCSKVGKDRKNVIAAQTRRYRVAKMPQNWGLAETRIVIRRNTPEIQALNEDWWTEIRLHSVRDQISLPYVCWSHKMRWEVIPGRCGNAHPEGPWRYMRHRK